jgi:hypothetical protein
MRTKQPVPAPVFTTPPFAETTEAQHVDKEIAALEQERRDRGNLPILYDEQRVLRERVDGMEIDAMFSPKPEFPALRLQLAALEETIKRLQALAPSFERRRDQYAARRLQLYQEYVARHVDEPTRARLRDLLPGLAEALEVARQINETVGEIAAIRGRFGLGRIGPLPGLSLGFRNSPSDYTRWRGLISEHFGITLPDLPVTDSVAIAQLASERVRADAVEIGGSSFEIEVHTPFKNDLREQIGAAQAAFRRFVARRP